MKAWILNSIGDIRLTDTDVPTPMRREVLLRVRAAGICGSDIPRIYETGAHRMPIIPGHEFSGVVEAIGEDAPSYWLGKRVGVFPLIPCRKCRPCMTGNPQMCRNYDYLGSRRNGAFAEYVCVPADNLIELPESVGFEEAAMLEPMAVSVHAIRQALEGNKVRIDEDTKVVVCGLGTIGLLLTGFLIERGFRNIYVIGKREGQKKRALVLGIAEDNYCDIKDTDPAEWINESTGGADIYFECVGRNESLRYGIESAAPGGTVITVGNPFSDMTLDKDIYWKILRNELTIRGTWNSTFLNDDLSDTNSDDWHYVIKRLSNAAIHPTSLITHKFSIDELDIGFKVMRDKAEDYCKVMMRIPDGLKRR